MRRSPTPTTAYTDLQGTPAGRTPELWCVHIDATGDFVPAPDIVHAHWAELRFNELVARYNGHHRPRRINAQASVKRWPHDLHTFNEHATDWGELISAMNEVAAQ